MNTQISLPKIPDTLTQSARRVWLASLGTVSLVSENTSKVVDQLGEQGKKLGAHGRKSFDTLVDRGTKLEKKLNQKTEAARKDLDQVVDKATDKAEQRFEGLQDGVDARLAKVAERLGLPNREQIRALSDRVEELTRKVEAFQTGSTVIEDEVPVVFHLVPAPQGWALKSAGTDTVLSEHPTKDKGLVAGRELAQSQEPAQLVVYKLDGEVQATYHYGDQ